MSQFPKLSVDVSSFSAADYSSSSQLPSIDNCASASNSSSASASSYSSIRSHKELSIKLLADHSNSVTLAHKNEHNHADHDAALMLDHADSDNDHNDEEIDKQYTMDPTHNKTPTPVMGRSSVIQDQCDDGFPMTEPVYDSKMDDELCALNEEEEEQELLLQYGYRKTKVITKTLQGNIFIAEQIYSDLQLNKKESNKSKANLKAKKVVIKKTSKALHKEHVTVQNGKKFGIYENILKECIILKHLTENKSGLIMTSFTKFENFFDTDADYYLVMEHGGSDLFDFIIEAHELINDKRLKIKEWRKFAKYLFWQMIVVLRWLHNDMNTCHLDISLENILIKNAEFIPADKDSKKYVTVNPNVQIKFCDFGLAEIFKANTVEFECTKFCGKTNYKAPEVYSKGGIFDARKADIWSLGVVLFCMLVGSPPYNKPVDSDQAYLYIKNSIIDQLLFQWERNHFITVKVLSLMHSMLRFDPAQRFLVDDVIKHPWLSLYYHKYKYQMKKKSTLQHQKNKRAQARLPFYNLPIKSSSVATSASKPSLISH